ncbi:hypothetical protein BN14_10270 [Rhizoctonia solani AG-1 IB]|uniref:Uncharacterized protein n=1 Tax=Thanatephorus cucumeris (strain AG1-IB / isolate 7/3/14) TaxID=1108050 RepID=M5CAQ6_THACB|nr:hypothetical protein BN14_10270 [Rhizoctonia solani AG-1 IB]
MPTYCYCARCKGEVKQKPRTIDDHKTRYPREATQEDVQEGLGGTYDSSGREAYSPKGFPVPLIPDLSAPSISRAPSPIGERETVELSINVGVPEEPSNDNRLETQPRRPSTGIPDGFDIEDAELVAEAEEERRYSFNQLLDNGSLDNGIDPAHRLLDDERVIFDEAEVIEDDDIYNENLGLPDEDNQQQDNAMLMFEYPPDDDEPPPQDDDPGPEDGPDAYYAARHAMAQPTNRLIINSEPCVAL